MFYKIHLWSVSTFCSSFSGSIVSTMIRENRLRNGWFAKMGWVKLSFASDFDRCLKHLFLARFQFAGSGFHPDLFRDSRQLTFRDSETSGMKPEPELGQFPRALVSLSGAPMQKRSRLLLVTWQLRAGRTQSALQVISVGNNSPIPASFRWRTVDLSGGKRAPKQKFHFGIIGIVLQISPEHSKDRRELD